jgi:hypothetical protein
MSGETEGKLISLNLSFYSFIIALFWLQNWQIEDYIKVLCLSIYRNIDFAAKITQMSTTFTSIKEM